MVSRASNQTDHHGGGTPLTRHDPDLLIRTSWVDASYACIQIQRGRATGNIRALRCRVCLQQYLLRVGRFIQKHCGKVAFLGLLLLSLCCVGLKTTTFETKIEDLWVEDGGRLSRELEYVVSQLGEGSGITTELVLQLPKVSGANVLTVQSLLLHLDALKAATKVEVYVFDKPWTFKEICNTANFPSIGENAFYSKIGEILNKLQPCMIITVLDCFWEGSKLLGPDDDPVSFWEYDQIKWTNLNPKEIIERLGESHKQRDIEEMLNRAGISSAYQEKPCLDPYDPDCPETAPNYESKQSPDVGAVVTGGCSGFATKFLHWEENLILGGIHKNRSGTITRAEALLSMVQLLGELDLYEFYKDHQKVLGINWNQNASRQILEAWQRTFTQEVEKAVLTQNKTQDYSVYSFSSTSLVDILEHFSQSSMLRVVLGYVFMLIYTSLMLMRLNDTVQSHAAVGMAGVLLVALSVAAGLGICSVVGIKFNASSTQIIPFLAMGLGVNDVFLIAHTYSQLSESGIAFREQTGECLKRIGVTVLLTSFGNSSAFFVAAIIPIPAMRAFCLQCAVVTLFHMASILLVYPAIMSLDLKRQREQRIDLVCCFKRFTLTSDVSVPLPDSSGSQPVHYSRSHSTDSRRHIMHQTVAFTDLDGSHPTTALSPTNASRAAARSTDVCSPLHSAASSSQRLASAESNSCCKCLTPCCHRVIRWSLSRFAKKVYGPFLQQTPAKIVVVCLFLVCLVAGIVGIARIKDGLDLTDIVPRFTKEYKFLEGQSKYFGFYHFFAVTQNNFDYSSANGQRLLHSYHQAFQKVDKIIKSDSGNLPDFWLQLFRSWLLEMQKAFDDDVSSGYIVQGGSFKNATSSGDLGYKLIIQTGDNNNPINKKRVTDGRLVDENGIIYPPAFYIYLTAWTSNDHLGYAKSQAVFKPKPLEWIHGDSDHIDRIPRSRPLTFAQLAFYLHNLGDTQSIISTIKEIRNICDTFSDRGLPNFPNGIIFTYWEQYVNLRFFLMLALIAVLAVDFVVVTIVLVNPWAAVIVVVVMAMVVVELFGFMGLFSIKLNAIPAVILIVAVGVSLQFSIYATMGFLTSTGSRNQRMVLALEYFFAPIFHGAISTLVGVVMLCVSEFQFIFKYFFVVLSAMVIIDMGNGLILIPVLLSIIGPNAEVIPANDAEQLSPPSPKPMPKYHVGADKHERHRPDKIVLQRMPPIDQLSTITEESSQCSSVISVDVVPEVVITTSTRGHSPTVPSTSASFISGMGRRDGRDVCSGQGHCCSCNRMRSNSRPVSESTTIPSNQQVTKIVATTRVKVEVHTPSPGVTTYVPEYKSKKRKRRDSVNTTVITGFDSSSSDS